MNRIVPLFLAVIFVFNISCKPKETNPNTTIEVLENFSELQTMIDNKDHELTVLNFWATTCAPCLKEMPHFNALETAYKDKKIKIILVSLENPERLDSYIYPFVKKLEIIPEVVVLSDQNYNIWTDFIDKKWYGALPATLILKDDKRNFKFGSYKTYEELQADVEKVLTK